MDQLSVAHINAQSLTDDFHEFRDHVISHNYDIVVVTETFLNTNISDDLIQIANYTLMRKDRATFGGGVAIYIKTFLNFRPIATVDIPDYEQLWVLIIIDKHKFAVGGVYLPHKSRYRNFLDIFEENLSNLLPAHDDILCLGDFNIDLFKFDATETVQYVSMLDAFGLTQLIKDPTRITSTSATLIDHILTTNLDIIANSGTRAIHTFSDHELIYCSIHIKLPKQPPIEHTFRDFSNFDIEGFQQCLRSAQLHRVLDLPNINDKIHYFNECILGIFDIFAPLKTSIFRKPKAPWLTDVIRFMITLRDAAHKRFKKSRQPEHFNYYKTLRNLVTFSIRNEKKAYLNHRFTQNNTKTLWQDLKQSDIYSKKQQNNIPSYLCDVNGINDFFIDSVQGIAEPDADVLKLYENVKSDLPTKFKFSVITDEDVVKFLNTVKSKATGNDNISLQMVQLCCPLIVPFITHIINCCLSEGVFPAEWKVALIHPIAKINSPKELKDLRPISILPTLSKVLEKIMDSQIRVYLEERQLFPGCQSGFRKNYSCTTAMLNISDDILRATDSGNLTVLVLLDFSKAFDTINHKILLAILYHFGFGESALLLIRNYLQDRQQCVVLQNNRSLLRNITHGVPQGSILGPLLYTIYSSSLCNTLKHCMYHQYADDTQVYLSFMPQKTTEACKQINDDLKSLVKTAELHSLNINPSKSVVIVFGGHNVKNRYLPDIQIKINDMVVPCAESARNLGVILDNKFRFRDHINNCVRKAYGSLKLLYSHRHVLNKDVKIMLCDALVLSQFNYCDVLYGPCLDVITSKKIQVAQNSCLRFIYGIRRREHITHKLKETKWLSMEKRRMLHATVFYHKLITENTPPYLCNKIQYRTDIHNLNLRHRGLITPPTHRTEIFKRSFSFNVYKLYNSIPVYFKKLTVSAFRLRMFNWLYN